MNLIGEYVKVSELSIASKETFENLKAAIETKAKSYCAIVWT